MDARLIVEDSQTAHETISISLDDFVNAGCFWVGLLRSDGTEVVGMGYARKQMTSLDADIAFPRPVTWGPVSHYGIFDAETGGKMVFEPVPVESESDE